MRKFLSLLAALSAYIAVVAFIGYSETVHAMSCSDGWQVTGYYTPVETDFDGPTELATIDGEELEVNLAFKEDVAIQAWGRLKDGRYAGYWSGAWQVIAEETLDFQGHVLSTDPLATSVATDLNVIPYSTRLIIPSLPSEWGERTYIASDIGPAIVGKHIDVYTGEGAAAREAVYYLTGDNLPNNTVCIK